ncbi:MAG: hypothetical protein AAGI49_20425 [Bacteroidota bacterium]
MRRKYVLLLALLCCYLGTIAQDTVPQYSVQLIQITDIHEDGVLVVRLESGTAKIKAIQARIANSDTKKAYWKNQLAELKQDLDYKNKAIMAAFAANYRFSEVLYLYDIDSKQLKGREGNGIFLDENLAYDQSIQLGDRPFIVATEAESVSGAEGIYLLDEQLDRLEKPLPHFVKLNSVFFLFNQFTSTELAIQRMYKQAAVGLNSKLFRYMMKERRRSAKKAY